MYLLLRARSFERWPLKVTFFAEDVFKAWLRWTEKHPEKLRAGLEVIMDDSMRKASIAASTESNALRGINALDVGYAGFKPQLTKSLSLLEDIASTKCAVCRKPMLEGVAALTCSGDACNMLTHLTCLSATFLRAETNPDALVPVHGHCPSCDKQLLWSDLVKELSLRMRGEKEVAALFKKPRAARTKKGEAAAVDPLDILLGDQDGDEESDDDGFELPQMDREEWRYLDDEVEDPPVGIQDQNDRILPKTSRYSRRAKPSTPSAELVVEDSDWDEAEIVT